MNNIPVWVNDPVFAPVQDMIEALQPWQSLPGIEALNQLASQSHLAGWGQFVCDDTKGQRRRKRLIREARCKGMVSLDTNYDARAFIRREILTRPGDWHDFFNALVWIRFPRTKIALTELGYQDLVNKSDEPAAGTRSRARDFLTMFDEGGAILQPLHEGPSSKAIVFGHGIFAALLARPTPLRSLAVPVTCSTTAESAAQDWAALDVAAALRVSSLDWASAGPQLPRVVFACKKSGN